MNLFAFFVGFMLGNSISPGIGILWGVVAGMFLFPPKKRPR